MENKILDDAAKAPRIFMDASAADGEEYNREPGLQLTKQQIIDLRKYEVLGLSLPTNLNDVTVYLNYGEGEYGGPGLTAPDFLRTFKPVYDHAATWGDLRKEVRLTGTHLNNFASSIIVIGDSIVEIYEDLKVSKYLEEYDIDTPEKFLELKQQMPHIPGIDLPSGDVAELKLYLNDMLAKVNTAHGKATAVRDRLDVFGKTMAESIVPEVKRRLEAVSKNTYQSDIKDLQAQIDDRSKQIDELNKQYEQMVQEAIKNAAGLNIVGLVLAIYTGVKAEGIRKQRNALKEQQQAANLQMAAKSKTLASLNRIGIDLQELTTAAIDAELATQNLRLVWGALTLFVEASKEEADLLKEATSLRRFKNNIIQIVEPWRKILVSSDMLNRVFDEAEREFDRDRANYVMEAKMLMSFNHAKSEEFNVGELKLHNAAMQQANVTAQMLYERDRYAPGNVDRIDGLVRSAGNSMNRLRLDSQETIIQLESSQKKLEGLREELQYPPDAEEVREDMEIELRSLVRKFSAKTSGLKDIHSDLKASYNREIAASMVVDLKGQQAYAQERKVQIDEQYNALQAEMKQVSEAIDSIVKAGIEKIGENVALSLDKLKELGLTPPQVQVALLAVDLLKKLIEGIGETVSFLQMVAALNRLREKSADLQAQSQKCARDVEQATGRIELLVTLDKIDDKRWEFVDEFAKLVTYFESQGQQLAQNKSVTVDEHVDFVIGRIPEITKYLKPITL